MNYLAIKEDEAECSNCVYYRSRDKLDPVTQQETGYCRRKVNHEHMSAGRPSQFRFALMYADDWCGDWEPIRRGK